MKFISLLIYVSIIAWFESLHHSQAVADQLLLSEEKPSKLEQIELSSVPGERKNGSELVIVMTNE